MRMSLTPILVAIELGFVFMLARRCGRLAPTPGRMGPVYLYLLWLTAYAIISSVLGARGVYISDDLLETLPGLWLQLITVGAAVLPIAVFSGVRTGSAGLRSRDCGRRASDAHNLPPFCRKSS